MPSLSNQVDVLVVGAGPTGLLSALELARAGIHVEIVDRAWRSTAQSYACGLHGSSLAVLADVGVEKPVLDAGMRVDTVGFYEGPDRRAELRFGELTQPFPFLVLLPQDRLEEILEEELRTRGVRVRWGHRLDDLQQDENGVTATVEKLGLTSVGYPYARSEEMVLSDTSVRARFVIGADGCDSHVRQELGIETEALGPSAAFEIFTFDPEGKVDREVRVAVGTSTTDAFWPQPGWGCRWSLELPGHNEEHPQKDRRYVVVLNESTDPADHARLSGRIRSHAPWFDAGVKEIDWTTVVGFDRKVARQFGRDRCWLVGDAGHQTGPVGMQSMNVGLREALDLSRRVRQILREGAPTDLLTQYDNERRAEWKTLLGSKVSALPHASAWAAKNRQRLLECIPGSRGELTALLGQLGLGLGLGLPAT